MKKKWIVIGLMLTLGIATPQVTRANPIVIIIKAIAKKVIKAMDLAVQKLQNKTIKLQNAQKVLENALSKLKLKEIGDWVEKQRKQYADYFDELNKVKALITYYHQVKEVMDRQLRIVDEYKRAFALFKNDKHFTPAEIIYMMEVYNGILAASVNNLEQLALVVNSFKTQMTDAKRMQIIDAVASQVEVNYTDLQAFNNQNKLLSLQRSKSVEEASMIKAMYGLP